MIVRRTWITNSIITKMVHILNKFLDRLTCLYFAFPYTSFFSAGNLVTSKRFGEDCYEGPISRKKNSM